VPAALTPVTLLG